MTKNSRTIKATKPISINDIKKKKKNKNDEIFIYKDTNTMMKEKFTTLYHEHVKNDLKIENQNEQQKKYKFTLREEIEQYGSANLSKHEKRIYDQQQLEKIGIKSKKNKVPYKMLIGQRKKNKFRQQRKEKRLRDSGLQIYKKKNIKELKHH